MASPARLIRWYVIAETMIVVGLGGRKPEIGCCETRPPQTRFSESGSVENMWFRAWQFETCCFGTRCFETRWLEIRWLEIGWLEIRWFEAR